MSVERCNRTIVAGHGYKLACPHLRGFCPVHDKQPYNLSDEERAAIRALPPSFSAPLSTQGRRSPQSGVPASPRLQKGLW